MRKLSFLPICSACLLLLTLCGPQRLSSHCDTMGGPVIKAAQKALETGNVNLVLVWVQKSAEDVIRRAFVRTLAVRKMSPEAGEMADMYFFETLVRIHRAGEGAPYTGLKPEGVDLGPVIPASDKAIEEGSADALLDLLTATVKENVRKHFQEVLARRDFDENDVEAGRRFVAAYVIFTHYVEGIFEAAKGPKSAHHESGGFFDK